MQTFQAESFNKAKKYLFDKNSCPYKSFAAAAAVAAALELFDEVCSAVIFYFSDWFGKFFSLDNFFSPAVAK